MLRLSGNTAKWTRSTSTPLDENGRLYGYGPATGDIDIAFIGPGPLTEDTYHGTFYAGQAGKFLSWGCASADIYRRKTWTTGLITTTAPRNDFSHVNATEAIKLEHNDFRNELQYLVTKRNLKVAVIWGDETLHTFGITSPVSQVRGSVYVFNVRTWTEAANQTDNTLLVIPTYAPDYLMKNRWTKSGKGRADYAAVWIDDLTKARRLSVDGWNPPKENFNLSPTFDDVYAYVQTAMRRRNLIAVDIETTAFTPDKGEIVCVGLAHSGEDAIVVPFLSDGGKHYWPSDVGRNVRTLLGELFSSCPLMFQNALFDVPFLQGRGFTCPMTSVQHDTLLLHHAVSPELPHKLGFIVSQYGDTPYWKDEFQNRDTTITRMDQTVLRRYNARDCVVLHQVLPGLLSDLDEVGSSDVYYNESIALLPAILQMMQTGVVFDHKARNTLRKTLKREVVDLEQDLRTLGQLPEHFNLSSDDDLRLLLYNDASSKYDKGEDYASKRVGSKVRDQLYALYDVRHNTVPLYPPKGFRGRRTDTGKLTVNKQGRLSYQRYLQNRLARLQELKRPTDEHHNETVRINAALLWLARYQDYTELQKILSTYMDYPVGDDDRVHTKFIVHGTATGRLASREPNLQNLPKKRSKDIRKMFVAPPEHDILAADYENLEVKVMAYETGDPELIDIVDNGKNMHDINTKILFGLTPDDPQWSAARAAAKIFMFGSLAYGGGDNEIYEKVILDVPELQLTFREFVAAKERYMASHPVYTQWREKITEQVRRTRRIENAFGRVRTFYGNDRDIVKEALNFPIQSAAASIINRATVRIYHALEANGYRTRLQAQIHDELRLEVPRNELKRIIPLVRAEMERPVKFRDTLRTFHTSMEYGPDWASLTDVTELEASDV